MTDLHQLQQQFDEEGAALVVRRFIAPSLRRAPVQLDLAADRGIGRTLLLGFATAVAFVAMASSTRAAPVYGPPAPVQPSAASDRGTLQIDQTAQQAKAEGQRRCAKRWALIGAIGGGALDLATTQANQAAGYRETNPLYGKHASVGEILLFKGATGAFTIWRLNRMARRDPAAACRAAKIYTGVSFLPGLANVAVRIRF